MPGDAVFWFLLIVSATNAARAWWRGAGQRGWLLLSLGLLVLTLAGRFTADERLLWAAAGAWLVLIVLPMILLRTATALASRERFDAARSYATLAAVLHPCDGWREMPAFLGAQDRANRGDIDGALELLEPLCRPGAPAEAKASLVRARHLQRWEEIVERTADDAFTRSADADTLGLILRAHGEIGDVPGMVDLWERHRKALSAHQAIRDYARLALFAFSGRVEATRRLMEARMATIPAATRDYWLATARLAAGETDAARREFERLLPEVGAGPRRAMERRLALIDRPPATLDERRRGLIDAEEARSEEEVRFTAPVPVRSPAGLVTRWLIGANVAVFVLESLMGGSTDPATLHRLGGLCTGCVSEGAWWRLLTSTFLHYGPLHLAMNLLALAALGPAAEKALGRRRFVLVYLAAGVGSMATVALRAWATGVESFTVGASGAVMGLIGSSAATMLRGWLRERAPAARSRGLAMASYVAIQMAIDTFVPQFSFTAHLAGAVTGFVITLLVGDRLARRADGA